MSNTAQSPASRRIEGLLDGNSFVEIGGQVTARSTDFNLQQSKCPSDGVVTGYGLIDGNLVYVYSQDASVLNGTLGENGIYLKKGYSYPVYADTLIDWVMSTDREIEVKK